MKQWKAIATAVCVIGLLGFSVYSLLDAFAICRVYETVETGTAAQTESGQQGVGEARILGSHRRSGRRSGGNADASARQAASTAGDTLPVTAETASSAKDAQISIDTLRYENTTVYVADIRLDGPAVLRTAFAQNAYGKNVKAPTSDTAASVGAVLAINGDNYGSREKGYVIRNGVLYRDTAVKGQEDLVIWADGSFSVVCEDDVTAQELLAQGAQQVFSFGPGLLADGEITVGASDEVDRAMVSNPRTAIGILEEGHYVLVVSDGRSGESEGLSLYELAELMQSLGVQTAYNLDGGGSSTMVYQGTLVNEPSTGRERAVTDIIYIA